MSAGFSYLVATIAAAAILASLFQAPQWGIAACGLILAFVAWTHRANLARNLRDYLR